MKIYRVDPEILILMADQMPLRRNEASREKTLNFKGAVQTTYMKESHSLSLSRVTVMTSIASEKSLSAPNLEFVFKGAGKKVKLNPPSDIWCYILMAA